MSHLFRVTVRRPEADAQSRKGHLSGNVSSGPVALMVVQLDAELIVDQPCHVK